MKVNELLNPPEALLEGRRLSVYEGLLPLLLMEEDGGGGGDAGGGDSGGSIPTVGDSTGGSGDITGEPVQPPPVTTTTTTTGPLIGFGGGRWFNEFYNTLKNLVVTNRILKRMTQLGISKQGKRRVKLAAKSAARNVNLLLSNPGATAYRVPQWTFDRPKTPVIKRWNEAFAYEFKKELARITEYQMLD